MLTNASDFTMLMERTLGRTEVIAMVFVLIVITLMNQKQQRHSQKEFPVTTLEHLNANSCETRLRALPTTTAMASNCRRFL